MSEAVERIWRKRCLVLSEAPVFTICRGLRTRARRRSRAPGAYLRRRYDAALQAQRDLDWAKYGEEMKRLGEALERLGSTRPPARR